MMGRLILHFLCAVFVNCVMGGTMAAVLGVSPVAGAIGLNLVAAVVGGCMPRGSLAAGVYTEIWTGELVKSLRHAMEGTWLDGLPDNSSIVNNETIHLVDVGVDPDVLVNNSSYPIDLQSLDDADFSIWLDKFQTKVTPVTDDELYAISYDKMQRVKESHAKAINDAKFKRAAYNLCPKRATTETNVLITSGEPENGAGRVKMTIQDLLRMKRHMDKLGIPSSDRRLVLCTEHMNDLLETDQKFREQYNINRNDGTLGRLYGFDIYEFSGNPVMGITDFRRDEADAATNQYKQKCSFAFYTPLVFKATGSTKMYYSEASTDPEYQRNKINFCHRFICTPKRDNFTVAMVSGWKTAE